MHVENAGDRLQHTSNQPPADGKARGRAGTEPGTHPVGSEDGAVPVGHEDVLPVDEPEADAVISDALLPLLQLLQELEVPRNCSRGDTSQRRASAARDQRVWETGVGVFERPGVPTVCRCCTPSLLWMYACVDHRSWGTAGRLRVDHDTLCMKRRDSTKPIFFEACC